MSDTLEASLSLTRMLINRAKGLGLDGKFTTASDYAPCVSAIYRGFKEVSDSLGVKHLASDYRKPVIGQNDDGPSLIIWQENGFLRTTLENDLARLEELAEKVAVKLEKWKAKQEDA